MLDVTKSINLCGESTLEKDGTILGLVTMSATIESSGRLSISKNVLDAENYKENKEQAIADMDEFDKIVYSIAPEDIELIVTENSIIEE